MPQTDPAGVAAVRRGLISLAITLIGMAVLLFVPAGTVGWPIGWWFCVAFVVCILISIATIWRLNPEIFVARSRIQPGTKRWDYVFIVLILTGFMAVLPVAGLDDRFGWSSMPIWVIVLGYVVFLLSFADQIWALAVNRHFEPGVRIQQDRGQTVIDTGPYAIVRHPGYVGGVTLGVGMALMLGSWWSLVPVLVLGGATAVRTLFEEQTLREGLPGYVEYTQRVRWRWVPGVW
jgi:protein-S-isoprenylcysteine O-methyltransferase Ste14